MLNKLKVRITGLTCGLVKVFTEREVHEFSECGVHELGYVSPFARAVYEGSDRTMVCTFLSGE
jgi:hypothetical protein